MFGTISNVVVNNEIYMWIGFIWEDEDSFKAQMEDKMGEEYFEESKNFENEIDAIEWINHYIKNYRKVERVIHRRINA